MGLMRVFDKNIIKLVMSWFSLQEPAMSNRKHLLLLFLLFVFFSVGIYFWPKKSQQPQPNPNVHVVDVSKLDPKEIPKITELPTREVTNVFPKDLFLPGDAKWVSVKKQEFDDGKTAFSGTYESKVSYLVVQEGYLEYFQSNPSWFFDGSQEIAGEKQLIWAHKKTDSQLSSLFITIAQDSKSSPTLVEVDLVSKDLK